MVQPKVNPKQANLRRRILLVEDNKFSCRQMQELLSADPHLEVDAAHDGESALELLIQNNYSLMITDLRMPRQTGMELLQQIKQKSLAVSVIVITGHGSIDEAVQAMHLGAYDFFTKPVNFEHLRLVVKRVLEERTLQDEVVALRERLQSRYAFHNIISKNPQMHKVFELINHVADTTSTVLIEGETGTGKEEVARAIQAASHQRTGPLVAVNCAALPENLLESELFGHEKGAFTSAVGLRKGRFELADGGTIFLDEVGDVPMPMQAKLLRVLQERRFERVGGMDTIEVDVRVIAATNRSLQRLVRRGTFREDLFYRLNVVKIDLPPLRERLEDIPLLVTHFTEKFVRPGESVKKVSPQAMELLLNCNWPGNIRELENAIERACVTSKHNTIHPENLPADLLIPATTKMPFRIDINRSLPEVLREMDAVVESQFIRKALKKSHGNVGRCAKICGISRRSLSAKIAEYQIEKSVFKEN
jgi:DNA-binding NtrC family response regulator